MQNIKELYILGKPIDTSIGELRFIKVGEYDLLIKYMGVLTTVDKNIMIMDIVNQMKLTDDDYDFLEKYDWMELLREYKDLYPLYNIYKELFTFLYNEDCFDKIKDETELLELLELIRKMNGLSLNIKNVNSEIAYFDELEKELEQKRNPPITFEIIYSTVSMFYNDIDEITIYKMNIYFKRIGYRFKHMQTVLYSSIDQKYPIEPWFGDSSGEEKVNTLEAEEDFAKNIFG